MLDFDFIFIGWTLFIIFFFFLSILHESVFVSIFFLIVLFTFFSLFLILCGFEFVGFIYLIVYVGAVAVLFLFMIMLFDKSEYLFFSKRGSNLLNHFNFLVGLMFLLIGSYFIFFFMYLSVFELNITYIMRTLLLNIFSENIVFFTMSGSNTELVGSLIYSVFIFYLLGASLVLLIGMVGAIILTQSVVWGLTRYRHQEIKDQILRNKIVFKK